eukprot:12214016-Karenia_brevis.AAC.1
MSARGHSRLKDKVGGTWRVVSRGALGFQAGDKWTPNGTEACVVYGDAMSAVAKLQNGEPVLLEW